MRKLIGVAAICAALACRKEQPAPQTPAPASAPAQAAPSPPVKVDEIEPNDFQHAQAIPARAVVSGGISGPKDDDWYRIEAPKPLALRIDLRPAGDQPLDAWLELYDRDRNRLLRVHAGGDDKGTIPAAACVQACFVRVSGGRAARYELTVLGDDPVPGHELEPNDRAVDANDLAPGKPMQGTFLSGEDEDWYRLALPAVAPGEFLRIELTAISGVRPELEVRALSDGALLASLRAGAAGEGLFVRDLSLHLGEPPPDAGGLDGGVVDGGGPGAEVADAGAADGGPGDFGVTGAADAATASDASSPAGSPPATSPPATSPPAGYYLVLKSGWATKTRRGAAPLTPYTLTASLEAGPPDLEQEPNDDPQHATPVQGSATGYLAPGGDQDWYRIHADGPSVLHAEVSGVERADVELAVFGPPPAAGGKPALLARANEGGVREGEVLPAVGIPAGDSYVLVQAAARNLDGKWLRDGEDRQTPYKLQLTLSPDDGSLEREPNNDVVSGQTLNLPAAVKGWIWPRKDVDVFRFHIAAGHAPVSLKLGAVRGVDLQLRLLEVHGDRGEVIGSSDSSRGEGEEKLLSVPLKEGDYAVEVSSPHNKDASATQPYALTIQ